MFGPFGRVKFRGRSVKAVKPRSLTINGMFGVGQLMSYPGTPVYFFFWFIP